MPAGLYNGMIAPLVPYTIKGAIWYQGENNASSGRGDLYNRLLETMIRSWREAWGQGDFPFLWVQLPNFIHRSENSHWPEVQDGMRRTLALRNTGMAVTIDIGMPGNIHPVNKQEVGRRLSLWALGNVYHKNVPATCGPLPAGFVVDGATATLSFTHAETGLKARDGELTGFEIAAADRVWKPAKARIAGGKVVVEHPDIAMPVAVRYAWAANPTCNLVNGAGLPASPFRTDDWPAAPPPTPPR
jgi:hypothetical protein